MSGGGHLLQWQPGQPVDYVTASVDKSQINTTVATGPFYAGLLDAAREEACGARRRAVVDRVIEDGTIRLMLMDGHVVWAQPHEVQSRIALLELCGINVDPEPEVIEEAPEGEGEIL